MRRIWWLPLAFAAPVLGASCESLASLALPDTTIRTAQVVAAGEFSPPGGEHSKRALPAFCRLAATLKPSSDSDINIEVWLPVSGWNGNYEAVGNGGWGGTINYGDLGEAILRGYATSSSDTGHVGGGEFALGHPEKLVDFGYRAEHLLAVRSRAVIEAFYGSGPKLSYFLGCSSGGRQALMEAQRYPADFDGIIAGAPTNSWTNLMFGRTWIAQAMRTDPASFIPPAKYPMIHKAVLQACDALDGVKDGVIDNPVRCKFDPQVLECKNGDAPDCLTPRQVETARKIYTGPKNPRTGQEIFPPIMPGSELFWDTLANTPHSIALANDHFRYVVFQDPNWDFKTLNFDGDLTLAQSRDEGTLSAVDPDLKPFLSHGKLIQYHGWTDTRMQPLNSVNYYGSVAKALGGEAKINDSYRLFMVPGMNHCGGGDGPNTFDMLSVMERWREHGQAPDQIIASHVTDGKVDRTRPLCPYPQVAKYSGKGSTDDAVNFACVAP